MRATGSQTAAGVAFGLTPTTILPTRNRPRRLPPRAAPDVDLHVDVCGATGVVARIDGVESGEALLVGELDIPEIGLSRGAVGCLVGVEPARVAVPDVDRGAVDRRALPDVDHADLERQWDAGPALGDVLSDPIEGDVEGARGHLRRQLAGLGGGRRGHLIGILREMRDDLAGSAAEHDGGPGRTRNLKGLAAGETVVRRVWSLFSLLRLAR